MDKSQQKKRIQLSFIIRDPIEKQNRNGINCLKYDARLQRLYAGGRDSIVRIYNCNKLTTNQDPYSNSLSQHTDWVNDMVLTGNGQTLFTASSDTTVNVWDTNNATNLATLRMHKDYVKCLAYAKDRDLVASAGFDKCIFLWDANVCRLLSTPTMTNINENKYSIYSIALNNQGTLLAAGSPENCIRLWDPRTTNKVMKLKGHTHNIRNLIFNKDGTQLLSASSDHTIRIWSLAQQMCIAKFEIHTEGVWTVCVNDTFTKCISAGKDLKIFMTDLRDPDLSSLLVCEEKAPILSSIKDAFNMSDDEDSDCYIINDPKSLGPIDDFQSQTMAVNTTAQYEIKGGKSLRQYHLLNDKRLIVTKDSDDMVAVWDVLRAKKVEDLGKVDYDETIKARQKFVYVPNWFTIDLKLGMLTITLDESDCQTAWLNYAKEDTDLTNSFFLPQYENKINYGLMLLDALFKNCPFVNIQQNGATASIADDASTVARRVRIPDHTPIIFSEIAGRTLYRIDYKDTGREEEQQQLTNLLPLWIIDPIVNKNFPKLNKIVFMLNPYPSGASAKLATNKDKLTAIDLLSVRKLKEHVHQKILKINDSSNDVTMANNDVTSTTLVASTSTSMQSTLGSQDNSVGCIFDRTIEMVCNEQVLNDPDMDLRTIKHLIFKGSGDFILYYRLK